MSQSSGEVLAPTAHPLGRQRKIACQSPRKYLFVASMDVDPDKEDLFNEVYDTEHIPNLLKVPGVHAVTASRANPSP